jgi:biopolymer transport protein TolR
MAGPSLGRDHRPLSEINVTPFVDVMLVLLIIFMVTAPLMQQGIDVDLPETTTTAVRLADDPLVVTVKKDGTPFVADQAIEMEELTAKLTAILDNRGDENVFLRADQNAPYGAVAKVMAAIQNAGAPGIGIITDPE